VSFELGTVRSGAISLIAMASRITVARAARWHCATCGAAIAVGTPHFTDDQARPHHLDCAIAAIPDAVRLVAPDDIEPDTGLDVVELTAQIEASLAIHRRARRDAYTALIAPPPAPDEPARDPDELLEQLAVSPDDAGVLAVLADRLQHAGDPRGELIAVQLALAARPADPVRMLARRDELMLQLTPLHDAGERCLWGTGYVRRVELIARSALRFADHAALWRHPSMRLLGEVRIELGAGCDGAAIAAALAPVLPRLRRLELIGAPHRITAVAAIAAACPLLEHLAIGDRADLAGLAHPRLHTLELTSPEPFLARDDASVASTSRSRLHEVVAELTPWRLPALVDLTLRRTHGRTDAICDALATDWLPHLDHLALIDGTLSEAGIAALAKGLAGRRLARLDVTGNAMPITLRSRMAALCSELICPDQVAPDRPVSVEHANRPDWGRGTLLRRYEGKLEVDFPAVGVKVFRADAPFLRFS
jgi:uncharacterized protein (TIGR02996 family)